MPFDSGTGRTLYVGNFTVFNFPTMAWTATVNTNCVSVESWTVSVTGGTRSNHQPALWQTATAQGRPFTGTETARVREQHRVAMEERRAAIQVREEARSAGEERARALLKSVLTPEQWASYTTDGVFYVVGSDRYTYRLENYISGNVLKLDSNGMDRVRYCAHPDLYQYEDENRLTLPGCDVLVGQVLALKTDAEGFCRMANVHDQWDANGFRLSYADDDDELVFDP